jgi:hypothetical protein
MNQYTYLFRPSNVDEVIVKIGKRKVRSGKVENGNFTPTLDNSGNPIMVTKPATELTFITSKNVSGTYSSLIKVDSNVSSILINGKKTSAYIKTIYKDSLPTIPELNALFGIL